MALGRTDEGRPRATKSPKSMTQLAFQPDDPKGDRGSQHPHGHGLRRITPDGVLMQRLLESEDQALKGESGPVGSDVAARPRFPFARHQLVERDGKELCLHSLMPTKTLSLLQECC